MLTKMAEEGADFDEVLKDAQERDMQRKILLRISKDMIRAARLPF